jgi:hypothetical protein
MLPKIFSEDGNRILHFAAKENLENRRPANKWRAANIEAGIQKVFRLKKIFRESRAVNPCPPLFFCEVFRTCKVFASSSRTVCQGISSL